MMAWSQMRFAGCRRSTDLQIYNDVLEDLFDVSVDLLGKDYRKKCTNTMYQISHCSRW